VFIRYRVTFPPSRCLATTGGYTDTHTQQRDIISLLYFFQNKESKLIKELRKWGMKTIANATVFTAITLNVIILLDYKKLA
jgi:hypothetical protein